MPTAFQGGADFDSDRDVDGADFLAWQRGYGAAFGAGPADGNSDGDENVDATDLAAWVDQYGQAEISPLGRFAAALKDLIPASLPSFPGVTIRIQ